MASEAQQAKAERYLAEGRIIAVFVNDHQAMFHCRGSDDSIYITRFVPNVGWICECPAHKTECVHVYAAKLITDMHLDKSPATLRSIAQADAEIDELLS